MRQFNFQLVIRKHLRWAVFGFRRRVFFIVNRLRAKCIIWFNIYIYLHSKALNVEQTDDYGKTLSTEIITWWILSKYESVHGEDECDSFIFRCVSRSFSTYVVIIGVYVYKQQGQNLKSKYELCISTVIWTMHGGHITNKLKPLLCRQW